MMMVTTLRDRLLQKRVRSDVVGVSEEQAKHHLVWGSSLVGFAFVWKPLRGAGLPRRGLYLSGAGGSPREAHLPLEDSELGYEESCKEGFTFSL